MSSLNRLGSYSISSIWLFLIIILCINYNLLFQSSIWIIAIPISVPCGIVLECIYSLFYRFLKTILLKTKLSFLFDFVLKKRLPDYLIFQRDIEKSSLYYQNTSFQETLSENNIIRNMWISNLLGILAALFIKFNVSENTVLETRIFLWLPFILIPLWVANFRTEFLLKKQKLISWKNKKHNKEVS